MMIIKNAVPPNAFPAILGEDLYKPKGSIHWVDGRQVSQRRKLGVVWDPIAGLKKNSLDVHATLPRWKRNEASTQNVPWDRC